jgi:propionyl-CoA carboxylase alpha chain
MTAIRRVLIANRGEIARRIIATCRPLGIGTVAVHSDADAGAPHVRDADAAVRLPGTAAADTYLRADLLVDAALRAGADAVHPGYGFLAEDAGFAHAVDKAGLTWIGPPAEVIAAMGSKLGAKQLMSSAGVPVLPDLDPGAVTAADLPVLVKASAGGGGRGMRVVTDLAELAQAVASAGAEAASAFGDGTVFCEPYQSAGRHLEVQILADTHGTVWVLGERECSIQRRHQKVIEESPSPLAQAMPGLRDRLLVAARRAAEAIGYVGAGTVEFLVDPDGGLAFLEVNTRLQVEHPVTECVTGLDLVAWQLAVARGEPLPPQPPASDGHAIEARLYAEDPAHGWRPDAGTLHRLRVPGADVRVGPLRGPGVRLDAGFGDGDVIPSAYDPMLAKLITWAPTRAEAAARLAAALAGARIHGLRTNRDLLVGVLRHPAFLAGRIDTAFLDRHDPAALAASAGPGPDATATSTLAAALAMAAAHRRDAPVQPGLPGGWRNVPSAFQRAAFDCRGDRREVGYRLVRGRLQLQDPPDALLDVELVRAEPDRVVLVVGGVRRTFEVAHHPGLVCVDSPLGALSLTPLPRLPEPGADLAAGSLLAPMPGAVTRLAVAVGDRVSAGTTLLWLEAMKMEHPVAAPSDGVVTALPVPAGGQVDAGALLAVISEDPSTEEDG